MPRQRHIGILLRFVLQAHTAQLASSQPAFQTPLENKGRKVEYNPFHVDTSETYGSDERKKEGMHI